MNSYGEDFATGTLTNLIGALAITGVNRTLANGAAGLSHRFNFNEVNLLNHNEITSAMSDRVTISNFYGLSFTHFKKKFHAEFGGDGQLAQPVTDIVDYSQTSYGIAPTLGIASEWKLTDKLSILGDLSAGFVIGNHSSTWNETSTNDAVTSTFTETKDNVIWATPITEANLAIRAQIDMKHDRQLDIKAGLTGKRYITDGSIDAVSSSGAAAGAGGDNINTFKNNLVVRAFFLSATYTA